MNSNEKMLVVIGILGLALIVITIGPLLAIWSWNELFGDIKTIEYTFWNWLAVAFLGLFFRGVKIERKK
jgi:hypothetical protein